MSDYSKLQLLLARVNATNLRAPGDAEIINLTEELSSSVRGGLNFGCGEELPNSSCTNPNCVNGSCNGTNNPNNTSCTNTTCTTGAMNNSNCNNTVCTN
jgi:hypothetical protein